VPKTARQVLISVNPTAGARKRGDRAAEVAQQLAARGLPAKIVVDLDEAAAEANALAAEGQLRALVAAGGDGTVAELVNRTQSEVPLAILPLGTENLLARYIAQSPQAETMAQTLADGLTTQLDAGLANGRLFLLMVGCGFDAEVVRRLHEARKGHIRRSTYIKPILAAIRSYQYPRLRIYCEGSASGDQNPTDGELVDAAWLFGLNVPRYGGRLPIAPDAVPTDGLLDVRAFRRGRLAAGLWYLSQVLLRRQHRLSDCTIRRVKRLRVESDEQVPYQIDGDPGGWLPLDVEMLPARLKLIVPRAWAQRQAVEQAVK